MTSVRPRAGVVILGVFMLMTAGVGTAANLTVGQGVTYETPSGFEVTTGVDVSTGYSNPFTGNETLVLGNVTFTAAGGDLTVDQYEGTWTNISSVSTNGTTITVNPADKNGVNITGGITKLQFRDVTIQQRTEFVYSATSSGSVTVHGLNGSVRWAAATASGTVIDSGTTTASGAATINVPTATDSKVTLYSPNSPTLTALEPADGASLTNRTQTFAVDVDDADFDAPTDELNVSIYVDGNRIHSENITSAREVNTTYDLVTGGDHTWYATATDATGRTTRLSNQSFTLAAKLRVLNETAPSQLVDQTSVDVTFYGEEQTITRSASDGTISFEGLPLNKRFEAVVTADGYRQRTIVIPSLFEQRRVWLLPDSASSVEVRFRLEDATGTFTQESELYIEKPIEINNETKYRIITSRQFGVDGVTTVLEKDTRYNLKIRNQGGRVAELSSYSAAVSETVTLEPNAATVQIKEGENIAYSASYSKENDEISIEYVDPAGKTEDLTISVISRDGDTTLLAPKSYQDPTSISLTVPTNGDLNETYIVRMNGTRAGKQISIRKPVGPLRDLTPTEFPDSYRSVLAIFAVLLVGGVFSTLNAGVGVLITALFGGVLWFFGILSGTASGGSIVLAIGVAALNLLNSRR